MVGARLSRVCALRRLERRFGLSTAPLLLGSFWVVSHLPLFLTRDILWPDVVVIMTVSVLIAAVCHSAPREPVITFFLLACALSWAQRADPRCTGGFWYATAR